MSSIWAPKGKPSDEVHKNSDLDNSRDSQHHTLGKQPTQAAAGDHNHSDSIKDWVPNVRLDTGATIAHTLNYAKYIVVGDLIYFTLDVKFNATSALQIIFDLPIPTSTSQPTMIGTGRESDVNGFMLNAFKQNGSNTIVYITKYDNTTVATTNWRPIISGLYHKSM